MAQLTLATSVLRNRKCINGYYGYYDPYRFALSMDDNFIPLSPKPSHFDLAEEKNWLINMVYPSGERTDYKIISGTTGNGILISGVSETTVDNVKYLIFSSTIKHNLKLSTDNTVRVFDGVLDKTFSIYGLGDIYGDDFEYKFIVRGSLQTFNFDVRNTRMCRVYGGQCSSYYVRTFTKIDLYPDTVKMGVSYNLMSDNNFQTVFQKKLEMLNSTLVDNKKRPITSLYCYIQKKEPESFFTDTLSGFELNPSLSSLYNDNKRDYCDIHKIHTVLDETAANKVPHKSFSTITDSQTEIIGDVCEWNSLEYKEYSLCDVYHRFNTVNREYTCGHSGDDGVINYYTMNSQTPAWGTVINRDVLLNYDINNYGDTILSGITNNFTYVGGVEINTEFPKPEDYYAGDTSVVTVSGFTMPGVNTRKLEGYIYKPLYEVKIREFSDDISESYTGTTVDVTASDYIVPPSHAIEVGGGRFVWREILNANEDKLALPLNNNSFYVNSKIKFSLKRQDPFGDYNLKDTTDPYAININRFDYSGLPKNKNKQNC